MEPGCQCKKDSSVTMVLVGNQKVGLVGLNSLFEEWFSSGKTPDSLEGEEVLASVRRKNYVSKNSEKGYIETVKSAYSNYWKKKQ
ncbi:MAG: hypothetical protein HXS44_04215 [Theionarchaea archaeon]|nr:hypothetical protein [Theionarchaea archaeon]